MAEHVQAALDLMVAPLQDLQERGVFEAQEIRAVVDRRRDSEYALRRRQPRKADFLRYLQAEMDLEKLRQLRSKRLLRLQRQQDQKDGKADHQIDQDQSKNTKHIGDKHVIQHIHLLWVRTLRKYRADVSLYLQYADFCKETGSFRKLSQCYSQALQLHPKVAGLWIEAASHEFFQAGSVPAARVLLQRGLRINQTAVDLWLQYFGLELHFVQKMQGRRNILMGGVDKMNAAAGNEEEVDQDEATMAVDKDKEERTIPSKMDSFAMATIVYDNAIKAIPDNVAFRLRFLDQCRLFPDTGALAQHIVDSIQRDVACQGQPEAWIARAMYAWEKSLSSAPGGVAGAGKTEAKGFVRTTNAVQQDSDASDNENEEDKEGQEPSSKRQKSEKSTVATMALENSDSGDPVLAVLQEATRTLQTSDMYLQAIRFLRSYMEQLLTGNGDDNDNDDSEQEAEERDVSPENEQLFESARTFLEGLLKEATTRDFYGSDLAAVYVDYLESCELVEDAVNVLEAFFKIKSKPAEDAGKFLPAKLWIDWARLVSFSESLEPGIGILQKALKQIPMAESDHMTILLELLGAKLMAAGEEGTGDFGDVFQRILLLAPGFPEMPDMEDPSFGISSVSIACLQYLRHKINKDGVVGARGVYTAVLFQSSLGKSMGAEGTESIKGFVDEAIEAEMNEEQSTAAAKNRLRRLYDVAVEAFTDTPLEDEYRGRRNEVVIYGMNLMNDNKNGAAQERLSGDGRPLAGTEPLAIPFFDLSSPEFSPEVFANAFRTFQVVHLRDSTKGPAEPNDMTWKDVGGIFERLDASDRDSWCIETQKGEPISAVDFLDPRVAKTRAYCSFIVQKDKSAYQAALEKLPLQELGWTKWHYEPALWFFFGRNSPGNGDLEGRAEHTDSVSHDGTWHYQLSGTKEWYIRPSPKLMVHLQSHLRPELQPSLQETTPIRVDCMEGDVIVINTRLWFHRTVIPPQQFPSVSYARDLWETAETAKGSGDGMKNVDGLYATNDIEVGTVIFTEKDAPDSELHRSTANSNCEVVELEDGTSAVVSSRAIAEGEFFCVPESSDEDDVYEEDVSDDDSSTFDC